MMTLAQILRKARLNKDVTLKEASGKLGIVPSYLHAFERGHRVKPKMEMLYKMADYYALNIDEMCVAAGRIPTDVFYKIIEHPKLLSIVREYAE